MNRHGWLRPSEDWPSSSWTASRDLFGALSTRWLDPETAMLYRPPATGATGEGCRNEAPSLPLQTPALSSIFSVLVT
jgi:hypothetical protein